MVSVRRYETSDWGAIERIHDNARKIELALAGLEDAFLPLRIAAEREGLFEYPGLFVALLDGEVAGFAACSEEELAWLYVEPARFRNGVASQLVQYVLGAFPGICRVEVLKGNGPATALYKRFGFEVVTVEKGVMPGNEEFPVEVYELRRKEQGRSGFGPCMHNLE